MAADSITVAANASIDFGSLIYGRQNYAARGWLSYDAEGVADRSFPAPRDAYVSEKLRSILVISVAERLIDKQNGRASLPPSRIGYYASRSEDDSAGASTSRFATAVLASRRFGIGIDVMFLRSRGSERSFDPGSKYASIQSILMGCQIASFRTDKD